MYSIYLYSLYMVYIFRNQSLCKQLHLSIQANNLLYHLGKCEQKFLPGKVQLLNFLEVNQYVPFYLPSLP